VATVRELLPRARPSEQAGLVYLPGGDEDYARAVRISTTLPLSAGELHQTGLDHVAALEARAVELGAGLGLSGLDQVFAALRDSSGRIPAEEAMRRAAGAVKRAEARAGEFFPAPLPPPCEVRPMPEVVAVSGAAPHYSPPRLDGGRPGTFWFNTERPTAGTGWDIDVVAFHEAVPGHHLQSARAAEIQGLHPWRSQASFDIAYGEGWALYAEWLGYELGFFKDPYQRYGQLQAQLFRAARLVTDTGIHAFNWPRDKAIAYMGGQGGVDQDFAVSEVDRYFSNPSQALGYMMGYLKIRELRARAEKALGPRFDAGDFHAVILDSGSMPLSVLERHVDAWLGGQTPKTP